MGNHDERVAFGHAIFPLEKHTEEERTARVRAIEYTRRTIPTENREYLSGLPGSIQIAYGAGSHAKKNYKERCIRSYARTFFGSD
jgi:hypothetical protein